MKLTAFQAVYVREPRDIYLSRGVAQLGRQFW